MSSAAGRHQPALNAAAPVWSRVLSPCAPKRAQSPVPAAGRDPRLMASVGGAHRGDEHCKGGSQGAEGEPLPRAFRAAPLPTDFSHPVGFAPLSATSSFALNLFPSPSRRGCVSQLRVGTPGQGRSPSSGHSERWPQAGHQDPPGRGCSRGSRVCARLSNNVLQPPG